jgi:hypothetical protein
MYPLRWGQTEFFVALGASKGEAISVLRKVNYAFFQRLQHGYFGSDCNDRHSVQSCSKAFE